jgi:hypothetical protein
MSKPVNTNLLQESIINLNTRKFGDVCEILITKIVDNLKQSDDLSYDKNLGSKKVEIKFSRAFNKSDPITEKNIREVLLENNASKLINDKDKNIKKWDCNIQQVKVKCFDILYYGVCFRETIYIFKITSNQLIKDETIKFSSKQHRGNTGEGQFHIKKNNIDYHIKKYLVKTLSYEEMWKLLS